MSLIPNLKARFTPCYNLFIFIYVLIDFYATILTFISLLEE